MCPVNDVIIVNYSDLIISRILKLLTFVSHVFYFLSALVNFSQTLATSMITIIIKHLCRLHIIFENYVLIAQTVKDTIKMCFISHWNAIWVSCKMQKDVSKSAQPKNNLRLETKYCLLLLWMAGWKWIAFWKTWAKFLKFSRHLESMTKNVCLFCKQVNIIIDIYLLHFKECFGNPMSKGH